MKQEQRQEIESRLQAFAENHLRREKHPDDIYHFGVYSCPGCKGIVLKPIIERHPGDRKGDFEGILWTDCPICRAEQMALGVTPYGRKDAPPKEVERPVCGCGNKRFYLASCDRWESEGIFDVGTVVAMCTECGELRVLLDTD